MKLIVVLLFGLLCGVQASEVSDAPKIVDLVERFNHLEGTNATFTCSIGSGDLTGLTFEWSKDDAVINQHTNPKKLKISIAPENYQSTLRVIDLRSNDAGVYTCKARNKFGQHKASTRLTVKVDLKWVEEPRDAEVAVGRQLHIPCQADGLPKPTIEWTRVVAKERSQSLGGELRIGSVQQSDAGYYECRATNRVDKDLVARVKLDVLGK